MSLMEIIAHVIEQFKDKREAITFLEKIEGKVNDNVLNSFLNFTLKRQFAVSR